LTEDFRKLMHDNNKRSCKEKNTPSINENNYTTEVYADSNDNGDHNEKNDDILGGKILYRSQRV
jgi:hypothetical protein